MNFEPSSLSHSLIMVISTTKCDGNNDCYDEYDETKIFGVKNGYMNSSHLEVEF